MTLYDRLPTSIVYGGKRYKLNLSFDRVLQFYDLQSEEISDIAKLELSLFLLVKSKHKQDAGLLQEIVGLLSDPKKQCANSKKSFDFTQDAKYIYAAFMQTYNIDLYEQRDKLHWLKFLALLNGLPSDTRFSEIVQIRMRPLPKPTRYNSEEIASIKKQKELFRLDISEAEREDNLQRGLAQMVRALEGMAKQEAR